MTIEMEYLSGVDVFYIAKDGTERWLDTIDIDVLDDMGLSDESVKHLKSGGVVEGGLMGVPVNDRQTSVAHCYDDPRKQKPKETNDAQGTN